jgi:sulfur carrier protein ThiS
VNVQVRLHGSLADRLRGGFGRVSLPDDATVEHILGALDLPKLMCVYIVNGGAAKRSASLRDGDRVEVYPPVAGG